MSEKPKSIWKKSWTGWRGLLLWFAALFVAVFFLILLFSEASRLEPHVGKSVSIAFISAFFFSAGGILMALFIRWLCCWKNFRHLLFGLACLITLIALLYAEEDWRGWHAWETYKHKLEAKGEKINFKDFVPPPVPDDENFALTPIVYTSYGEILTRDGKMIPENKRDKSFVVRMEMPLVANYSDWPTNAGGSWERATLTDLKPWQDYYRQLSAKTNLYPVSPQPQTPARDVLLALSRYDAAIEELRNASKLPYSRFPLNWDNDDPSAILLPHLARMKSCIQFLRLRAVAELQNNESDKALDDVKLMFYLNNSIRNEPFIISHLVRIAMMEITMQPVYEGLAGHKWSEAQLAELDSELSKFDFLADYEFSMRGERVLSIANIDYLRRTKNTEFFDWTENGYHSDWWQKIWLHAIPAAFFYQSKLNITRMHQQWTLPMVDITNRIVSPKECHRLQLAMSAELNHFSPYKILARMLMPAFEGAVKKYSREQSVVDLARTAIALERYRLANGDYPNSLDALAPQFMEKIPHDVIDGKPLNYRLTDEGQFVLYSISWNGRDDGGVVGYDKSGRVPRYESGDLVWRYPRK